MDHELVRASRSRGLVLHPTLVEMLAEHHSHRTERRGCGYTQATRFIAALVCESPRREGAGWGLFDPAAAPGKDRAAVAERLAATAGALERPESGLLLDLMVDLCRGEPSPPPDDLPLAPEKLKVGSCPLAEQYFLEIAHGRIRRGGRVCVWHDAEGHAVLVEKRGLGDEHSGISVRPLRMNGVRLPPGSLIALDDPEARSEGLPQRGGLLTTPLALRDVRGRFLRLTTLAVAPADRPRAFSAHYQQQLDSGLFSPDTTTIAQLRELADSIRP